MRPPLVLVLVLVLGSLARAGEIDQARDLARKGKLDEAEKLLDEAQARLSGKEARDVRRARAEITSHRPDRASFERARDLYLALAKEDEDDVESRWALYELLWTRGERLVAAIPKVSNQEELHEEARKSFAEGAEYLEKEWKALDAKGTESADRALVACGFFLPRCLASQGRLEKKPALLVEAVKLWTDYGVRYGREAEGYEAAIDMTEVLLELGRREDALNAIEAGLAVEDCADPEGKLAPAAFEIFERASLVKGRMLLAKDAKGALTALEKAIALAKKSAIADEATGFGKLVRVERAHAWAQLGRQGEAIRELERLVALDPRGPAGELAQQSLARLAGRQEVTSERALGDMNDALDRSQFALAVAHAQSARMAARREAKKANESLALEGLGRGLEGERRVLEAAIAYEQAATPRAAVGFVRCAETVRARDPGKFASSLCERALALLSRDPAAKRGLAPFLLGKQLQEAGRWSEAAKSYDDVAPDAGEIRDEALFGSACCHFADANGKKEALEAVESRLRELLAKKAHPNARLLLAETLLQLGRPAEVEAVVPGDSTPEIQYRAIALARTGHDAESLVSTLLERKAVDHRTAVACHELIASVDSSKRSSLARYYEVWLDDASPRDVAEIARSTFLAALPVLGLSEKGGFLVELDGDPAPEAKAILDVSARAWEKLLARGASRERWKLLAARAETLALARKWETAVPVFAELVKETKLLGETGHVETGVAAKEPLLLGYLADMGLCELRAGAREKGESHLAAVVEAVREATPLWWHVRLALLRDLDRRGSVEALKELKLVLRALGRKYPGFEAAKELAPRFLELSKRYE